MPEIPLSTNASKYSANCGQVLCVKTPLKPGQNLHSESSLVEFLGETGI